MEGKPPKNIKKNSEKVILRESSLGFSALQTFKVIKGFVHCDLTLEKTQRTDTNQSHHLSIGIKNWAVDVKKTDSPTGRNVRRSWCCVCPHLPPQNCSGEPRRSLWQLMLKKNKTQHEASD